MLSEKKKENNKRFVQNQILDELIIQSHLRTEGILKLGHETSSGRLIKSDDGKCDKEKVVTNILQSNMCMGCGACVSECPVNALTLQQDEWGYYRSTLDYDKCINCGKCAKVCPALKLPQTGNFEIPKCYEFVAADENLLRKSSSGGVFGLLAEIAFEKNGCVVGATWTDELTVEHIIVEDANNIGKLQKSKYLQSYLGDIFKRVKDKVDTGRFVIFSGCPCQAAGLRAFLKKDYENLLIVDLLCGHSPSTLFFKKYLDETFPQGIKKYEFRHKSQEGGWDCSTIAVTMKDDTTAVFKGGKEDSYQRVFHNHTMCAPHCEKCKYQSAPRFGDLTIGDFWGIGKKDADIDTTNGVSVVLCNNEKGKKYLKLIPKEEISAIKEVPLKWLGRNGYVINGHHNWSSPNRDDFYKAIKNMSFSKAVNYALKPNHGMYNEIYKNSNILLQYDTAMLHFQVDSNIWEEHFESGNTVLRVKPEMWKVGKYAILSLCRALKKGKKYVCFMQFKVRTVSNVLNFHIKDSGSNLYQVIKSYKRSERDQTGEWIEIKFEFVPNSEIYDEFMIGASQIKGEDNYLVFKYIYIKEKND